MLVTAAGPLAAGRRCSAFARKRCACLSHKTPPLLSNAAKFRQQGEIDIRLNHLDGCLILRVQDTGVGIPAAKLEAIFESFVQVDGSTTRRHDGSGLGLAICRNLVALMGGEIEVESAEQVGTVITITIPARRRQAARSRLSCRCHEGCSPRGAV